MKPTTEQLERSSYKATIVASVVAILALCAGSWQFFVTQRMQQEGLELERQIQIIALNNDYQKLQQEAVDNAQKGSQGSKPQEVNSHEFYDWRANLSVTIAESIYNLDSDRKWDTTVRDMIIDHQRFIVSERLECDTYTDNFIKFVEKNLPEGSQVCKN
ncbi:MAG: hypothetical protein ACKO24_09445 [Leptolyngbyaceae cyanobacterium]